MIAYADSTALVKLTIAEPESAELRAVLRSYDDVVTSELAIVEVTRAARRAAGTAGAEHAAAVLASVKQLRIDQAVLQRTAALPPPTLPSLDAIHVASALELEASVVIAYDDRLLAAATSAGCLTSSPGW